MTYNLRPDFLKAQGPLDMRIPADPTPTPPIPWKRAYSAGVEQQHESWLDRLNADRTWGSRNPAEQSGDGIVFGYSWNDLDAVIVADMAMQNTIAAGNPLSTAEFSALIGDGTFSNVAKVYPDPTRTLATYSASIAGPVGHDAFCDLLRTQERDTWNLDLTAPYIITYIRAGFGL